jgi:exodeoxyribonuclease VII small subunit
MQWCAGDVNFTVIENGSQFYLCGLGVRYSGTQRVTHLIMGLGFAVYQPMRLRPTDKRLKSRLNRNTMAKSSASSAPPVAVPALPATYEAALQELEGLVSGLESGQLPLDQLLTGYQRGAQLLAFCKGKLEAVETQIKVLEGTELKPWA